MSNYNGTGPETIQGINYNNLQKSSKKIINELNKKGFRLQRLYAQAIVVRDTYLRPKTNRNPDAYKNSYLLTNLVFVAGPNVGAKGSGDGRSTTKRTFNTYLSHHYDLFIEAVKWTYFAALHSIAMEGKRIALLPWISGDLYAGNFKATYGVNNTDGGSEMQKAIGEVLKWQCNFQGKPYPLGHAFDRVAVVHLK